MRGSRGIRWRGDLPPAGGKSPLSLTRHPPLLREGREIANQTIGFTLDGGKSISLPYNRKLTAAAKKLRNDMTEEEKKLWYQYLSGYTVRFLRQKVIENCILDFYCAKCRMAIEVDGGQQYTERGIGHDEARTKLLNAYGLTVIRFTNDQVRDDFGHVCKQIDETVRKLLGQKSDLSQP